MATQRRAKLLAHMEARSLGNEWGEREAIRLEGSDKHCQAAYVGALGKPQADVAKEMLQAFAEGLGKTVEKLSAAELERARKEIELRMTARAAMERDPEGTKHFLHDVCGVGGPGLAEYLGYGKTNS